jgi:hypothetical protein
MGHLQQVLRKTITCAVSWMPTNVRFGSKADIAL